MQKNTNLLWGSRAKLLHWLTAMLILAVVSAGYVMASTYRASFEHEDIMALHNLVAQIHITIGLSILVLVTYRLSWRLRNPVPDLPSSLLGYQRWLARVTHIAMYGVLFIMPLSGWAANSVLGDTELFGVTEIWFLGWDIVPSILPQLPLDHAYGYPFFASIHHYALYIGSGILVLHIIAALWHHFLRRDKVLLRMWPAAVIRDEGQDPSND
jgi:cytochrome b561